MSFFTKKELSLADIKELYAKGQVRKALEACGKYVKKSPDFDACNLLGELYYKAGERSKFVNHCFDFVKKLENDKYYEKAAAVLRKGIKYYPDQFDFYRYLAKIFEKKGLKADQVSILKELADCYEKKGNSDKALDVLREIFEIDNTNYEFLKYLVKKLKSFNLAKEVCKYLSYGLEMSYKNNDKSFLYELVEDGINNKCIFGNAIKYTFDYFKEHPEKIDFYIKTSKEALLSNFDEELYNHICQLIKIDDDREFYLDLYKRYTNVNLFNHLLDYFINTGMNQEIINMINRIKDLNEKEFDKKFADIFYERVERLPLDEIYENLLVIAKMANHWELREKLVSRFGTEYQQDSSVSGGKDMFDLFETDINKKDSPVVDFESTSFIEATTLTESGEDVSKGYEIDLDLSEFENKSNSFGVVNVESNVEQSGVEDFELDLSEHIEADNVVNELEPKEIGDQVKDIVIDDQLMDGFSDLTILSSTEDEKIKIDFNDEIEEINRLIEKGNLDDAKNKIEELLILDPENEQLKDLILKINPIDFDSDDKPTENIRNDILRLDSETSKVVSAIKKSIEELVSPDDYEMHYDLALAYMEMELYDEAVVELKKAASGKLRYESLVLIAECYKRSGRYDEAIDIYKLVILDYGKNLDVLKNSIYEIATIYELKGDKISADTHFKKLFNLDPNFRDVSQKIKLS